jgi:hypothetical protein
MKCVHSKPQFVTRQKDGESERNMSVLFIPTAEGVVKATGSCRSSKEAIARKHYKPAQVSGQFAFSPQSLEEGIITCTATIGSPTHKANETANFRKTRKRKPMGSLLRLGYQH